MVKSGERVERVYWGLQLQRIRAPDRGCKEPGHRQEGMTLEQSLRAHILCHSHETERVNWE